ncbi:MAG: amino acid adenylation domain-containing protein [Gemmatimonadota bacterium]|jgi:amino acid adenylation domain-containing protein
MTETFVPRSTKERIIEELKTIFHELSGLEVDRMDSQASFLELGFDSLFLAQVTGDLKRRFKVKVSVRQLMEKTPSIDSLSVSLEEKLPDDFFPPEAPPSPPPAAAPAMTPQPIPTTPGVPMPGPSPTAPSFPAPSLPAGGVTSEVQALIQQQLQLMQQQLQLLGTAPAALVTPQPATAVSTPAPGTAPVAPTQTAPSPTPSPAVEQTTAGGREEPVVHGPWKPVDRARREGVEERQQEAIAELTEAVVKKTGKSKEFVAETRRLLADPRSIVGFRSDWKDLVYPLVMDRAKGSRIWDTNGNEYVDVVGAFGVNFLGHSPDFVTKAVQEQLERGFAIGPHIELAGRVAKLVAEVTGMERVSFCNTGSEAVLAALRIARTVTGNNRVASFKAHYHGIFDEVLVKAVDVGGVRKNFPIAPGIPQWAVDECVVLDYGDPASLDRIREQADDLACVILEPVRSRNPDLQPFDFVRELRALTRDLGIPLIFDEMITGFRCHLGGAQALLGVDADIATYGKVVGGGYPIGVVAGRAEFMDALDGGHWEFGDDSIPEADMTWFAGTFVRHPVAMAAAEASLTFLKEQGPGLQERMNARTTEWVQRMNEYCEASNIPVWLEHFSSFFMVTYTQFQEYSDLLPYYLLKHGVFSRETRPLFFSIAHTDEDLELVAQAHKDSFAEMQAAGLMTGRDGTVIPVGEVDWAPDEDGVRVIPLTEPQWEVWVASQFGEEASSSFNLNMKLPIRGALDVELMKSCLQELVDRHEALRTTFTPDGDAQRIHPELALEIPVIDLTHLPEEERTAEAKKLEIKQVKQPFDLVKGPLVRARILKLGDDRWTVLFFVHHIVADGWSCGVLSRDLGRMYSARKKGEKPTLNPVMQLSEYVRHLRLEEQVAEQKASEEYWLQEYATIPPPLNLPTDRQRPAVKTFPANRTFFSIEPEVVERWKASANKNGSTLFAFTFAAFSAFIQRITGQDDFAVGSDLAGQALVPGKDLVSHCVSFLPIRITVDGSKPFTDLLADTRGKWFDIIEYQNYTYGTLLRKLDVPTDPSRVPLVAVAFNLDPSSLGLEFADLETYLDSVPRQFEVNDLFVNLVQLPDGGIELQCTYNLDLFDEETVIRRMRELIVLMNDAAARPEAPISELALITEEDKELLKSWNDTAADFPLDSTVHELVEAQARKTPEARALMAGSGVATEMTYGEMNQKADALAARLQDMGVHRDSPVVVCMERSAEMIVGLLAVLKSGGAYLPVDPEDPEQRQELLIEDSGAAVILTQGALRERLPEGPKILAVDEIWEELEAGEPEAQASADSLAYIIYTSGSTGTPKGVMVEHRSVVNQICWLVDYLKIEPADVMLHKAPFSFDTAVEEIFPPLIAGATLLLARPEGQRDPAYLIDTIQKHGVTIADFVPSMINEILAEPGLPDCTSLRAVVTGGEATTPALRDRFLETSGAQLINGYGPTEATVQASAHRCEPGTPSGTVPIGRPVANTKLRVLDRTGKLAPIGVPGELCIGGAQIARGYLNRPEKTAEQFIPDLFAQEPGARLYRTGDLCRFRPDGELEFLGRIDHQVKLRGYRIELGEIEAVLEGLPEIRQAVVELREVGPNNPALVAYITLANGGEPDPFNLQRALSTSLPEHMIPQHWMILPDLPLGPSGKVDRKVLPDPERSSRPESEYVEPETEMERALAAIWKEVLGIERVGTRDDFFRLGGHSILAIRVASRIRRDMGIELPLRRLFATPLLGPLAQELEGLAAASALTATGDLDETYEEEVVI